MIAILLPAVLPILIEEGAKVARRVIKERRKERQRKHSAELNELRERIEQLEASARWG